MLPTPTSSVPRLLPLESLVLRDTISPREQLKETTIHEYAELYKEHGQNGQLSADCPMPPLAVFCIDGQHIVADGFHRARAAQEAGLREVPCLLYAGTARDAMLFAARANSGHGLRYTPGDKQRILRRALADPEIADLSSRKIAKLLGMSHTYVDMIRKALDQERNAEHTDGAATLATPADVEPHTPDTVTSDIVAQGIPSQGADAKPADDERKTHTTQTPGLHPPSGGVATSASPSAHQRSIPVAQTTILHMVAATFGEVLQPEQPPEKMHAGLYQHAGRLQMPDYGAGLATFCAPHIVGAFATTHTALESVTPEDLVRIGDAYVRECIKLCDAHVRAWRQLERQFYDLKPGPLVQAVVEQLEGKRYTVDAATARQYGQVVARLTHYLAIQTDPPLQAARRVVEM